jgi:signal transduction histidine kinase
VGNFADMTEALKSADTDLRLRSSGIAHELRTPLAVLRGRLVGVQSGLFAVDERLIDSLLRQVGLIERLTNDLSLLCDTRGMGFALDRALTVIADVIAAVVDSLTPIATDASIRIDVRDTAGDSDVFADVDAARLERAICNLVENAIHHSGGRVIMLALEDLGDAFRILVDDDGDGWKIADPESLTRPFVTGEFKSDGRNLRTGLGLAIVQAIAHAHHGTLSMEASPLGGARAVLRLPKSLR